MGIAKKEVEPVRTEMGYNAFEPALRKVLTVPKDEMKKAGKAKVNAKKPKKKS